MKRIRAKYFKSFDDNNLISEVLNHIKARLNLERNTKLRYNYNRSDHEIRMNVRINGRYMKLDFDITKSDIMAEIDRKLRYLL